jgi:hypothetical protein
MDDPLSVNINRPMTYDEEVGCVAGLEFYVKIMSDLDDSMQASPSKAGFLVGLWGGFIGTVAKLGGPAMVSAIIALSIDYMMEKYPKYYKEHCLVGIPTPDKQH